MSGERGRERKPGQQGVGQWKGGEKTQSRLLTRRVVVKKSTPASPLGEMN